ncbi:hypothetical protein [Patulibacter sp. SYSU D01012]|uniref:hypothetical protein n=1 Tax=Patulibacter sp. SYSU D01012 TaxID=2817381 RepID=UPI001B313C31|nr:hypothetical protein [Patulibacter sp. SYSU D01012]
MSQVPPTAVVCPRCGNTVGEEQAWCLSCGAPARTRMRPTPNWKLPLAAVAALVLVVAGGTLGAFVALTTTTDAPEATTTQTVPGAVVPAATTPGAPATGAPAGTPTAGAPATGTPTDGAPATGAPAGGTTLPEGVASPDAAGTLPQGAAGTASGGTTP